MNRVLDEGPGAWLRAVSDEVGAVGMLTTTGWIAIALLVVAEHASLVDRGDRHGRRQRRELSVAVRMALGALVVGVIYGHVFGWAWTAVSVFSPPALVNFWSAHPVIGFAVAFIAWDASGFAYHWIGHHTAVGWAAHSPHHSASDFNASVALRLSWMPWHGLLHHPLLALAGFDFETILMCIAISNAAQAAQHCLMLPEAPGWLGSILHTPSSHRHHHSTGRANAGSSEPSAVVNLGPVFTIWDRLVGTFVPADSAGFRGSGGPIGRMPGTDDAWRGHGAVATELRGWLALFGPRHSDLKLRTPPETGSSADRASPGATTRN